MTVLLPLLIGGLALALYLPSLSAARKASKSPQFQPAALPQDVQMVLENYSYRETGNGLQLAISGERIVHRGKPLLGLRSNLVKACYFQNPKGTIRSKKDELSFSANEAEWDPSFSGPLTLRGKVELRTPDRPFSGLKWVRVHFRRGTMEIPGKRGNETIRLDTLLPM